MLVDSPSLSCFRCDRNEILIRGDSTESNNARVGLPPPSGKAYNITCQKIIIVFDMKRHTSALETWDKEGFWILSVYLLPLLLSLSLSLSLFLFLTLTHSLFTNNVVCTVTLAKSLRPPIPTAIHSFLTAGHELRLRGHVALPHSRVADDGRVLHASVHERVVVRPRRGVRQQGGRRLQFVQRYRPDDGLYFC